MVKFGIQNYNKRTPMIFKIIGDSLLAASTTVTSASLFSALGSITDPEQLSFLIKVSITSTIVGGLGKFLSKLFGDISNLNAEETIK